MTQLETLRTWIGAGSTPQDTALLQVCLDQAEMAIRNKRGTPELEPMETRYNWLQIEIATYLYNKRGVEGQKAHSENGVSRMYESASVPASMLEQITPLARVVV